MAGHFDIRLIPDVDVRVVGDRQSFELKPKHAHATQGLEHVSWWCVNESGSKTGGPNGSGSTPWRDAEWTTPGFHWVIAEITRGGVKSQAQTLVVVKPQGTPRPTTLGEAFENLAEEMLSHLRITADPPLTTVVPEQRMTFRIESTHPDFGFRPDDDDKSPGVRWFCVNDPSPEGLEERPWHATSIVEGPKDTAVWKGASWGFTGRHRIVAVFVDGRRRIDLSYNLHCTTMEAAAGHPPAFTREHTTPEAVQRNLLAYLRAVREIEAKQGPPPDKADAYEARMQAKQKYHDALRDLMNGTRGSERFPIRAQHFSPHNATPGGATSSWLELNVFLSEYEPGCWALVDWTNPLNPVTCGQYDGLPGFRHARPQEALNAFDWHNSYPEGVLRYEWDSNGAGAPVRPEPGTKFARGATVRQGNFETDGSSAIDHVASVFNAIAFGAAVVAGVVTLVAPVPGSRVVSALIWTSLAAGTASATLTFAQRRESGEALGKDDAIDALTVAANLLGAGAMVRTAAAASAMKQGAVVTSRSLAITRGVIYASFAPDAINGFIIAEDAWRTIESIKADPTLAPDERFQKVVAVLTGVTTSTVLLVVNLRMTRAEAAGMSAQNKHMPPSATPAEIKQKLENPKEVVELDEATPSRAESTTSKSRTTATAKTTPSRVELATALGALRRAEREQVAKYARMSANQLKKLRPAHATVVDTRNLDADGAPRIFNGVNKKAAFDPSGLHPTMAARRDAYLADQKAMAGRRTSPDDGDPGHHAEVQAVSDALWARRTAGLPDGEDAIDELLVSVVLIDPKKARLGEPFGCCNDCQRLLTRRGGPNSVTFPPEQAEVNALPEGKRMKP